MMLHSLATWLEPYASWLSHTVLSQSALAPLLLLFVEEAGIPLFIPGDAVLIFTGARIAASDATPFWLAVCVAMIAVLCGATILFFVSRRWGHLLVDKVGKFVFLRQKDIARAEELFKKYGVWAIIVGRHIPGMRIPLTIFAGTAGMRYLTFILSTIASTLLWVFITINVGIRFGGNIERVIRRNVGLTVGLLIVVVVAIVALHFLGRYNSKHPDKD